MAKQIKLTYEGKEYILEFNRRTVARMERNGFVAADAETKPMTTLPALFKGAFLAHHPFVKDDVVTAIYDRMPNKEKLIGTLIEMYTEPIQALMEEPEESEGNVEWTVN